MTPTAHKCHCIFYHPQTEEERAELSERARYFRNIGDMDGFTLVMVQLTTRCLAELPEVQV